MQKRGDDDEERLLQALRIQRCNNNNMEDISAIYKDVFLDRSQVLDAKYFPLALFVCVQEQQKKILQFYFQSLKLSCGRVLALKNLFSILEELRMHFFVLICLFSDLLEFVLKLLAKISLWCGFENFQNFLKVSIRIRNITDFYDSKEKAFKILNLLIF